MNIKFIKQQYFESSHNMIQKPKRENMNDMREWNRYMRRKDALESYKEKNMGYVCEWGSVFGSY